MSGAPVDLDRWAPDPAYRIRHHRDSRADPDALFRAGEDVTLADSRVLGRMISWRMHGVSRSRRYGDFFRSPPFVVIDEGERHLVSGLCGRIWVVRGGLAKVRHADEWLAWDEPGTVRVMFANWVEPLEAGSRLVSEVRVMPVDARGRSGLRLVRPIVLGFQHLIGSEALRAAVRKAG